LTPPTCSLSARSALGVPSRATSPRFSTLVWAGSLLRSMPEPSSGLLPMTSTVGRATSVAGALLVVPPVAMPAWANAITGISTVAGVIAATATYSAKILMTSL